MARTRGARDLKKRKRRSDRKHKYVKRKGKLVPYKPKRSRGDPIKIWWWMEQPMSREGYLKWSRHLRSKIRKITPKPYLRVDVSPNMLSTKDAIRELAIKTIGHTGKFYLMMFSHGKNKFHVKPVKVAEVEIFDSPSGLDSKVTNTWRISRYWFWRG